MVAAEQRHGGRAILGQRDDWGLAALVMKVRGNGADQDPCGAEADDAAALAKQLAEMGGGLAIGDVAARHAVRRVDFGTERFAELPGQREGAAAEDEEDGLHHASVPA